VADGEDQDVFVLKRVNDPPISDSELKCAGELPGKGLWNDFVKVSGKPGNPVKNAPAYRLIELLEVIGGV
jgi:hypothetical protein